MRQESYEVGIRRFLEAPYESVWEGYNPTLLDCWAVAADNTSQIFIDIGNNIRKFFSRLWDRYTLKEFLSEGVITLLQIILVVLYPFTFWFWGTVLYLRLKGYRLRRAEAEVRLAEKLDGQLQSVKREDDDWLD